MLALLDQPPISLPPTHARAGLAMGDLEPLGSSFFLFLFFFPFRGLFILFSVSFRFVFVFFFLGVFRCLVRFADRLPPSGSSIVPHSPLSHVGAVAFVRPACASLAGEEEGVLPHPHSLLFAPFSHVRFCLTFVLFFLVLMLMPFPPLPGARRPHLTRKCEWG